MNQTEGKNGVVITRRPDGQTPVYRTYEVYQRERVGESTEKIKPRQLASDGYRENPYPLLEILRENYPCYRDWLANSYWITQYDDVTSVFVDDANFESRSKAWIYGMEQAADNLMDEIPVLGAEERLTDQSCAAIAAELLDAAGQAFNLATDYCAMLPMHLLIRQLQLPRTEHERFISLYWRMQRGTSYHPGLRKDGIAAIEELSALLTPLLDARRDDPGDDIISAMIAVKGADLKVSDVVVTLLERDHETLHGGLANLCYLLLTHEEEMIKARSESRMIKLAWLETLRHSTPVLARSRFARHEVERFGRLIPEGARLLCSAAAANRDPRVFSNPDDFIVDRKDLSQREPRGHYRADGLATGVAFGLGKPTQHPAIPEDRPRSRYAITRDTAVTAMSMLLDRYASITLESSNTAGLAALSLGEMHTSWSLPVNAV